MNSLIAYDDMILMWAAIAIIVGVAVSMERHWKWAARIGATVLCIFFGLILANLRVIPFASPVYAATSGILLPLGIPMLLFKSDIRRIIKEAGQKLVVYNIVALTAFLFALLIPIIWSTTEGIREYAAVQVGGFVGGTVNVISLNDVFALREEFFFGITIVGNFFVGMMIMFFNFMYKTKFFKRTFRYGADEEDMNDARANKTETGQIDMVSIIQTLAVAFLIFGGSSILTRHVNGLEGAGFLTRQLFGNNFIVMTIVTTIAATAFPKFLGNLKGSTEIGTLFMTAWFLTLGAGANINIIINQGLLVLAAYLGVFALACTVIFTIGKFLNWRIENMMVAIDACIGGPPTVAALCATMKWNKLIVPGILVALYGVIIGNFVGILVGNIWGAIPL